MLNVTTGQHVTYHAFLRDPGCSAGVTRLPATVVEVTPALIRCRVPLPSGGCTVYAFQRSDGYRCAGSEFGWIVIGEERIGDAE